MTLVNEIMVVVEKDWCYVNKKAVLSQW